LEKCPKKRINADYKYAKAKSLELQILEKDRAIEADKFLNQFNNGDNEAIEEELKRFHKKLKQWPIL